MDFPARLSRIHLHLTPTKWIVFLSISAVLAALSASLLLSRIESGQLAFSIRLYDQVERFFLDTIRLSFTNRRLVTRDNNVYVAPLGLLDKDAVLALLDGSLDYADSTEQSSEAAIAPARILDSDWNPQFSPPSTQRESR